MKCPKCHAENPEGARFCRGCGSRLKPVCPQCGIVNPPGSGFCNKCGHSLTEPTPALTVKARSPSPKPAPFTADRYPVKKLPGEGGRKRARSELEKVTTATVRTGESAGIGLYHGKVELVIAPPAHHHQIRELQEALHNIQDLRLVLVSGTVKAGSKIIVSAGKSMPLVEILSRIPNVTQVISKGNTIQITLRVG